MYVCISFFPKKKMLVYMYVYFFSNCVDFIAIRDTYYENDNIYIYLMNEIFLHNTNIGYLKLLVLFAYL